MKKISILLSLTALFFMNSCSTDFDVLAPYKETAVVFGLLNPNDSIQYIKINRAYLGEGNALVMAQQRDSINYQPGQLDVKMERLFNGVVQETFQLDTTTMIPKDGGTFSNPYQLLYKTSHPILKNGSTYRLRVFNNADQQTITAETPIVQDFSLTRPGTSEQINWYSTTLYTVAFNSATNGKVYNLLIRFHYNETNLTDSVTTSKYLDWNINTITSGRLDGGEAMQIKITGEDFYKYVANKIPVDGNLQRVSGQLEFMFTIGADDLNTYIEVNKPSIGIIQEKPEFSNVTGGIGLLSSRWTPKPAILRNMSFQSLDSLRNGRFTKDIF